MRPADLREISDWDRHLFSVGATRCDAKRNLCFASVMVSDGLRKLPSSIETGAEPSPAEPAKAPASSSEAADRRAAKQLPGHAN
jgi:hypothetical protein